MAKYRKHLKKLLAVLLIICMFASNVLPANATGIVEPRASDYLDSYNAYIYPASLGRIQIWFTVTGVNYMDEIGSLTILLYESTDQTNWTWVKTYKHDTYTDMLDYNDIYHTSHVEYSGTIGRYYKAYVTIWAGKDGAGDTRYFWTQPKKATLFAG